MKGSDEAGRRVENGESTQEYSGGTDGYSAPDEDGNASPSAEPWWKRAGYSSLHEFIDEQDRLRAKYEILPKGTPVPETELPGAEVGTVDPATLENRVRQINVKLRPSEGEDLDLAAKRYGLAPSTLARALVNRGVRAILEADALARD